MGILAFFSPFQRKPGPRLLAQPQETLKGGPKSEEGRREAKPLGRVRWVPLQVPQFFVVKTQEAWKRCSLEIQTKLATSAPRGFPFPPVEDQSCCRIDELDSCPSFG